MKLQVLKTGKDGVLPVLNKNAEYIVIEKTNNLKIYDSAPARFASGYRHVVTLEDFTPFPSEEKVSTKPQGE